MMLLYFIAVLQLLSLTGASESGIVGGKESKPHSRRYMAELQVRGHHVCGGILIRKDFVLTSAHCKYDDMLVVLGAHNIAKHEASQQKIPVAEYHPHPKYDYTDVINNKYDIMLLKLKTNAKLNKNVRTIGLPEKDEKIPARTDCLVMGWGRTGPNTPPSEALRETKVKIEFSDKCKYKWGEYFARDQMICIHTKTDVGIQQGDSGGPLVCGGKVHGISAFVDDHYDWKTDKYRSNVFIKVSFFIQWIETVMKR